MATTNLVTRETGTNDFITVDMTDELSSGETISGTPTLTPSNGNVSLVGGTVAVSSDGLAISGRFLHNSAGFTRVDITCSTSISGVVKKSYFIIRTVDAPPDA